MKYFTFIILTFTLIACNSDKQEEEKKEKKELGNFKKTSDLPTCNCSELDLDSLKDIKLLKNKPYTGICTSNYPDDSTIVMEEIQYLDGRIHGYYRIYSKENVILTEDQYVNGKKQNVDKKFTCDCDELSVESLGNDKIQTYLLNGSKFTGICDKYTKDGKMKILDMQFKDGLRHGNSIYYDQYGEPITADVYKEGKFVKTVVYTREEE
ncbi:MAG: hypothetical protein R2799_12110 [Crocinitomicaceae bacterium]